LAEAIGLDKQLRRQRKMLKLVLVAICGASLLSAANITVDSAVPRQPVTDVLEKTAAPAQLASTTFAQGVDGLFGKTRESVTSMSSEAQNVICREEVRRFQSGRNGVERHLDDIQTQVTVENGAESYSSVLQNGRSRKRLPDVGGLWSEGEYLTFLGEARRVLSAPEYFTRKASQGYLGDSLATVLAYEMNANDTSWEFQVSSRHYTLPFQGEIWVSKETGEILRIRRTAKMPDTQTQLVGVAYRGSQSEQQLASSGVAEIEWSVDFATVSIGGRTLSLPTKALYRVTYKDGQKRWNTISFSGYQQFGAETVIRYDIPAGL
jgi:hypothetical protein